MTRGHTATGAGQRPMSTPDVPRGPAGRPSNLVDLLRQQARRYPGKQAYSFLGEDEVEQASLTYAELDYQARAIGGWLQASVEAGDRALLLYPPGLEFISAFFGCQYAGVVAVPAYPPRPYRPMQQLQAIIADAAPSVVLSTSALHARAAEWFAHVPELLALPWMESDEAAAGPVQPWNDPRPDPESLAFLQYTSGSTAAPKGVMVSHGNLLHNSALIQRAFETGPDHSGVIWLPLYHDMGLIGGMLQTVYGGGASTLFSPVAFLQRPARWLQTISTTGATISGGPDFAYDLCARKIDAETRAQLDLSRWELAFTGAEPVRRETIDRFVEAFAPCGFRREAFFPCYGLAEATLMVSGGRKSEPPVVLHVRSEALSANRVIGAGDALPSAGRASAPPNGRSTQAVVGCGRSLPGQRIAVVDPDALIERPPECVGEIWVSGPSVAQGYYNAPEATRAVFGAHLADTGEGPFLRTGDLGFLHEGELFVTGRLKDLIIIRGRNYYPQDIEYTVQQCHPGLRPGGAAFSVSVDGEEQLVVVQEIQRHRAPRANGRQDPAGRSPHREADADSMIAAIRQAVAADHEVDVYVVVLLATGTIPRTTSGKIRRRACREGFLADDLEPIARWTRDLPAEAPQPITDATASPGPAKPTERPATTETIRSWLVTKLSERLGISPQKLNVEKPFVSFGMSSVQVVALAAELEQWIGRRLSPTFFYNYPTVMALARYLAGETAARPVPKRRTTPRRAARSDDEIRAQAYREVAKLSEEEMMALISRTAAELI